ncbi:P33 [Edwardsiella hoshinae]|nr:P33 [Edwardsiella hoshinae]
MTFNQIEKVRGQSKAGNNGPWQTHWEEMAKKTVIRRLFKYLPVSIEMQKAVILDEKAEANIDQENASVISAEFSVVEE